MFYLHGVLKIREEKRGEKGQVEGRKGEVSQTFKQQTRGRLRKVSSRIALGMSLIEASYALVSQGVVLYVLRGLFFFVIAAKRSAIFPTVGDMLG